MNTSAVPAVHPRGRAAGRRRSDSRIKAVSARAAKPDVTAADLAAGRRRRAVCPGRGRGDGELRGPVPAGLRGQALGRWPRWRPPSLTLRPWCSPAWAWRLLARPPRDPGAAAQRGLGGSERVHERDRRCPGLAGPGGMGDATDRLRAGQRHADRRGPHRGGRPSRGRRRGCQGILVPGRDPGTALWLLRLAVYVRR